MFREGRPTPLDAREARFAGLLSREEIQAKLDLLDRPLQIRTEERDGTVQVSSMEFQGAVEPISFTEAEYQEYREDFAEDIVGLQNRLQRLKMRLLQRYLRGAHKSEAYDALSWDEQKQTPMGQVEQALPFFPRDSKAIPEEQIPDLIVRVNQFIPKAYRLRTSVGVTGMDLKEMRNILFNTRFDDPPGPSGKAKARIETLLDEITELEVALTTQQTQGELFSQPQQPVSERVYQDTWDRYRELAREIATDEELSSWFSPTYEAAGKGQIGHGQSSEAFRNDYQRFRMPEMKRIENWLTEHYVIPEQLPRNVRAESALFPSGLAALQGVFSELEYRFANARANEDEPANPVRPIMMWKGTYYEASPQISALARREHAKVEVVDTFDPEALLKQMVREFPMAVFLDPMSVDDDLRVTPLSQLIERITSLSWQDHSKVKQHFRKTAGSFDTFISLVIDNTSLGRAANWKRHLDGLPDWIRIFSIESLVKYAQDGQEITQAGLVTCFSNNGLSFAADRVQDAQSRQGLRPPESIARRLAAVPPSEDVDKKMERHTRNATRFGRMLEAQLQDGDYLSKVVYPGLESHPDFELAQTEMSGAAGLLSIHIGPENMEGYVEQYSYGFGRRIDEYEGHQKAEQVAQAFKKVLLGLAKEAGVELNGGTSYGFSTSRLAVYKKSGFKGPFLRVAIGTETTKDIVLLAKIFQRANAIFTEAYKQRKLLALTDEIVLHRKATVQIDRRRDPTS